MRSISNPDYKICSLFCNIFAALKLICSWKSCETIEKKKEGFKEKITRHAEKHIILLCIWLSGDLEIFYEVNITILKRRPSSFIACFCSWHSEVFKINLCLSRCSSSEVSRSSQGEIHKSTVHLPPISWEFRSTHFFLPFVFFEIFDPFEETRCARANCCY